MKGTTLVCALALLASMIGESLAAPAQARFVPLRASLIKHGWTPVRVHRATGTDYPPDTEEGRLAQKYPELEACSVDAGMLCRFWYSRNKQCLLVVTKGEQLKNMRAVLRKPADCPE